MAGPVPLILVGFGHVGKAFFDLLQQKGGWLKDHYGFELKLQAIFVSSGGLFSDSVISPRDFERNPGRLPNLSPLWRPGLNAVSAFEKIPPGILVECTPSNIQTGEPGLTHIKKALKMGWHVVTANKGPLVVDLKGLRGLAAKNLLALKYSAAAAAALPTLDAAVYSLAGAQILSVEGILNGTSNFILTRMGEGSSYSEAIKEAQDKGIAEHDPRLDVEGWDTAVKLLLIGNSVLGLDLALGDIKVEGITSIAPGLPLRVKHEGNAIRLIGQLVQSGGGWEASVSPRVIARPHPLFAVVGTNKGVSYTTDTMGTITITGGKSDPRGAAAALLKDIIHLLSPLNKLT